MAKNIVVCDDGTWNHPDQTDNGMPADTNVYKFYKALLTTATQQPLYDDGVGADGSFFGRLAGGAIGDGLFGKIKDGYTKVAHNYQPGDQIFLFGFSRGAYTARSLAGMIAVCGLPDPNRFTDQTTEDAFAAYRTRTNRQPLLDALQANYGNSIGGNGNNNVEIAAVGVWDTVGSLGIPGGLFEGFDDQIYGFLDTSLHPDVKAAWHALSIDERRRIPGDAVEHGHRARPGAGSDLVGWQSRRCRRRLGRERPVGPDARLDDGQGRRQGRAIRPSGGAGLCDTRPQTRAGPDS